MYPIKDGIVHYYENGSVKNKRVRVVDFSFTKPVPWEPLQTVEVWIHNVSPCVNCKYSHKKSRKGMKNLFFYTCYPFFAFRSWVDPFDDTSKNEKDDTKHEKFLDVFDKKVHVRFGVGRI